MNRNYPYDFDEMRSYETLSLRAAAYFDSKPIGNKRILSDVAEASTVEEIDYQLESMK